MPAKNRVKTYQRHGYYYIYNSGIDNRDIFTDEQDYQFFLNLLKIYLTDSKVLQEESDNSRFKTELPYKQKRRQEMNLSNEVRLLAFCLMPNRLQLFIKQSSPNAITQFMRRIITSYVTYYNRRYHRAGTLFQGVYKGVLIMDKEKIIETINHIHSEPISVRKMGLISTSSGSPAQYPYSSLHHYLEQVGPIWLDRSDLEYIRSDLKPFKP